MAAAKGKAKTAKKKKESRLSDEAKRVIRVVVAFIFLVICGVTLASLVSYIFTWQADQSIYHNPEAWSTGFGVQNICGKLGFVWADLLIAKLFGIGAFFVPIFLGALAFYCMKIRKVRLVRIFLLSLYGCIIFSLLSANVTAFFPELLQGVFSSNAGGSYGYFANLWLTEMIGPFGAAAIILLLFFIWITLLTRKVALWFDNLIYKAF
ncbi:MAG: DNA translocase FtsK 4TM domain-containing protein, partial [Bacteroidales bacterium]|nr:DNA translocase FtsK 4TM domain-containing protein [Bacteroidales bacterium]